VKNRTQQLTTPVKLLTNGFLLKLHLYDPCIPWTKAFSFTLAAYIPCVSSYHVEISDFGNKPVQATKETAGGGLTKKWHGYKITGW